MTNMLDIFHMLIAIHISFLVNYLLKSSAHFFKWAEDFNVFLLLSFENSLDILDIPLSDMRFADIIFQSITGLFKKCP